MTVQDYIRLSQDSVSNFLANFLPIFTNIVAAVITLAVGIIVGYVLKRVVEELSKAINLEKSLSNWDWYAKLIKSHEDMDVTNYIGEIARWSAILVFLIPSVTSLDIAGSRDIFSQVFGYVSTVVLGSLWLLFGFVIAWFIHRAIMAVGSLVGNNPSHLLANVAYLSMVIFASFQAIAQFGVPGDVIRLIIIAILAGTGLAVGLAGRDSAADLIKRLVSRASK